MHWLVYFLAFCPIFFLSSAQPAYKAPQSVASTEGLPSSIVNESVCVISGEYVDAAVDLVVPGPEPLVIQRRYGSHSLSVNGNLGRSWSLNHGELLILGQSTYDDGQEESQQVWVMALRQPSGTQLDYMYPVSKSAKKKKRLDFRLITPKGLTNGAAGLSGRTNIRNQTIRFYPEDNRITIVSGSGDRRDFVKVGRIDGWTACAQTNEEKVNGSVYSYHSPQKRTGFSRVECRSRGSGRLYSRATFKPLHLLGEELLLVLTANDGRKVTYRIKEHKFTIHEKTKTTKESHHLISHYLTQVDSSSAPTEKYEYGPKEQNKELHVTRKKRPEGRFLETEYYQRGENRVGGPVGVVDIADKEDYRLDRVKKQRAPVGTDRTPITTHRFLYRCKEKEGQLLDGITDVYDAYNQRTRYAHDKEQRLTSITRYRDKSPYSRETFLWSAEGNLLGKILKEGRDTPYRAHYFTYDERGNVLTSRLCGNLTGHSAPLTLRSSQYPAENGYESEQKTYTYSSDGLNLELSETDSNGKTLLSTYLPGTDRLTAQYTLYDGQIRLREFYSYNDDYALIEKIVDDGQSPERDNLTGVTERRYTSIVPRNEPPVGLPLLMEEGYFHLATGQRHPLRSQRCSYSPEGHLLQEEHFDANGQFAYSRSWEYDAHGNVTREINPLGESLLKAYDANDNLIFEQGPSGKFHVENTYDFANRLIRQEEVHADGQRFVTTHAYDYLGQCLSTTDPYGHETRRTFDPFGRVETEQGPPLLTPQETLASPLTAYTYDLLGNPLCTTNPLGHHTLVDYNIRGQPLRILYPDHTQETFVYRLDGQLLQKTEKGGARVVYTRDPLGRLLEESVYAPDGPLLKQTRYHYNALHLLSTTDPEGNVTQYTYDPAGRLEWTLQEGRRQQQLYDSLGRPSELREWFGEEPHEYRATLTLYDLLDRPLEERIQTAEGELLHLTRYAYDADGNRTLTQVGERQQWTEYNAHGNPVKITNALGHTTHITYDHHHCNPQGQRVLRTLTTDPLGYQTVDTYDPAHRLASTERRNPLGLTLSHQTLFYDLCGNRCRLSETVIQEGQSLRRLETHFLYSEASQPIAILEAVGTPEQKITRTLYDACGRKTATLKPDGQTLAFTYDSLGRLETLTSSDGSIAYLYHYDRLDRVTRAVDLRYALTTERRYDPLGQLIQETLGNGLTLSYAYDPLGRIRRIDLPDRTAIEYRYNAVDLQEMTRFLPDRSYRYHHLAHTLSGQILASRLPGDNGEVHYTYDPLDRRISIASSAFSQTLDRFDAAGNLLAFRSDSPSTLTYDDYYHLQSEPGHAYRYDSLGNRIAIDQETLSHNALNQILGCLYDLNGNLIHRTESGDHYTYDPLDRLIRVSRPGIEVDYRYDPFNRRIIRLQEGIEERFLYQGQEEIGRWKEEALQELKIVDPQGTALSIELQGIPYTPIHDLFGNIVSLLDLQGHLVERYRYTAFGETETLLRSASPWRYAGKRIDPHTALYAFGLRDYDPTLGRWLTPDPAGFTDGSNLYAYLHNSPLIHRDPFGLFANRNDTLGFDSTLSTRFHEPRVTHVAFEHNLERRYNFRVSRIPQEVKPFERTASYSLNDGFLNPATRQPFQLKETPGKEIIFINGICNTKKQFDASLTYLGRLANHNIKGVHSASFGLRVDAHCYLRALRQYAAFEGVRELQTLWSDFFEKNPAPATLLTICHSRGAVYVRNALMDFPHDLRKRIEVIAVAPGGYIQQHLCRDIIHYVSPRDIVPWLDIAGRRRCHHTIVILKPHPAASPWLDHSFTSPTYRDDIKRHMDTYLTKP